MTAQRTEPPGRTQEEQFLPKARRDARDTARFRAYGNGHTYFVQYLGGGGYQVERYPNAEDGPLTDAVYPDRRVLDLTGLWDKSQRERLLNGR